MTLPYKVTGAYERVVEQFRLVAENANAGSVKCPPVGACFSPADGETHFECYIYLKDWPWRPGKTSERVRIVIKAYEEICEDELQITKSTVCVCYLASDNGQLKLLQSIHFDFDGPQDNHPVFHAQLTHEAIPVPPEQAKEIGFEHADDIPNVPCFKGARIPTSDMTFSSVLLCIAADHLPAEFVRNYMQTLSGLEGDLPTLGCDELRGSIGSEFVHFKSRHWLSHMTAH